MLYLSFLLQLAYNVGVDCTVTDQTSFRTVGAPSFVGLTELLILNLSVHLYAHHGEYSILYAHYWPVS
jgi:hypothetical protein